MAQPQKKILKMKSISKSFPGVQALSNVSIDLYPGEILGICGENGAGKSTLMNILSGKIPGEDCTGEILLAGQPVSFTGPGDAKRKGIEMIQQEISLHLDLTVAENVFLGSLPRNRLGFVRWQEVFQKAEEALALVHLDLSVRNMVRQLNTSQQQLLAIAKALMQSPAILVLDEPTSALTETEADNLLAIIQKLKEQGISCIYISHRLEELFAVADRLVVLRDGQLISTYPRAVFDKDQIIEDMVGRVIDNFFPKIEVDAGEEALRVENLSIPHPLSKQKYILENISFSVKKGEIFGLAGLVGSGRSELLSAIFGELTEGVTGRVFLEGQEIMDRSPRRSKQLGLGYLTENRKSSGLVGTMDIARNITLASLEQILRGMIISHPKEVSLAEQYREQLSIRATSVQTNVLKLSGGNQQKVVLAKWLLTNPKLLLLDEPTKGIDVGAKVDIYNLMTGLAKKGVAIILVTSEMPELIEMSDRILVLSQSGAHQEFRAAGVSQEEIMEVITQTKQLN